MEVSFFQTISFKSLIFLQVVLMLDLYQFLAWLLDQSINQFLAGRKVGEKTDRCDCLINQSFNQLLSAEPRTVSPI